MKARCELCDTDQDVRYEVTRFVLTDSYYWESGARCVDRKACRDRVEAAGNRWVVLDPEDLITAKGEPMTEPRTAAGRALSMAHGDWLHNAVMDIEAEMLDMVRLELGGLVLEDIAGFSMGFVQEDVFAILDRLREPQP